MAEEKLDHTKEWEKFSNLYKSQAKEQLISDPMWYRHKSIEGLLSGITFGYN